MLDIIITAFNPENSLIHYNDEYKGMVKTLPKESSIKERVMLLATELNRIGVSAMEYHKNKPVLFTRNGGGPNGYTKIIPGKDFIERHAKTIELLLSYLSKQNRPRGFNQRQAKEIQNFMEQEVLAS